ELFRHKRYQRESDWRSAVTSDTAGEFSQSEIASANVRQAASLSLFFPTGVSYKSATSWQLVGHSRATALHRLRQIEIHVPVQNLLSGFREHFALVAEVARRWSDDRLCVDVNLLPGFNRATHVVLADEINRLVAVGRSARHSHCRGRKDGRSRRNRCRRRWFCCNNLRLARRRWLRRAGGQKLVNQRSDGSTIRRRGGCFRLRSRGNRLNQVFHHRRRHRAD